MKNNATPRSHFDRARASLLLYIVLTAVNIVLYLVGSETYFLFSLALPYFSVIIGDLFAAQALIPAFLVAAIAFAAIVLLVYVLLWFFSKNSRGCFLAAAILYVLDTAFLFLFLDTSVILDLIFHATVLFELFYGLYRSRSDAQFKAAPAIDDEIVTDDPAAPEIAAEKSESDTIEASFKDPRDQ